MSNEFSKLKRFKVFTSDDSRELGLELETTIPQTVRVSVDGAQVADLIAKLILASDQIEDAPFPTPLQQIPVTHLRAEKTVDQARAMVVASVGKIELRLVVEIDILLGLTAFLIRNTVPPEADPSLN